MEKHYPEIAVINPTTGEPCSPSDWSKVDNPTAAEWLLITPEYGPAYLFSKRQLAGSVKFEEANELAAEKDGTTGTRRQWLDISEALESDNNALNKVLDMIGGDPIDSKWYWTSETFQSGGSSAWLFTGTSGYLYYGSSRIGAYAARLFRASEI